MGVSTGAIVRAIALAFVGLAPAICWAQEGAIAGVVKDPSGAVLPGVTVEAASPALIEKVRTVVTDETGQYKVANLRPGLYSVTFTLTGFKTIRREGIQLLAEATANVIAELEVGGLEETVTVSGQSPLVDVQTVTNHKVITAEVTDQLPAGKAVMSYAVMMPGMRMVSTEGTPGNRDVGGNQGDNILNVVAYGSRNTDSPLLWDGMWYNNVRDSAGGASQSWSPNVAMAQEIVVDVAGHAAESANGGPRVNAVPRDGSNVFHADVTASYTKGALQSNNVTQTLIAQGASPISAMHQMADIAPVLGGPIFKDRLWFIGGYRYNLVDNNLPFAHYAVDPLSPIYAPDLSRPTPTNPASLKWEDIRLTAQISPRNKMSVYIDSQQTDQPFNTAAITGSTVKPEGSAELAFIPAYMVQSTFNSTITNRFLLEAGGTAVISGWKFVNSLNQPPSVIPIVDLGTGFRYHSYSSLQSNVRAPEINFRVKASYVTGSHTFQVGSQMMFGDYRYTQYGNNCDCTLQFLNGVPRQITVYTTPYMYRNNLNGMIAIFGQDQWTHKGLTLMVGGRLDTIVSSVPAQSLPPVQYVGARNFGAIDNIPNWKDFSPRFGASWDVFGNGKTAVKASLSRYVEGVATGIAGLMNPVLTTVNSTTRPWTDLNGDYYPQPNELGPLANNNFGKTVVAQTFDPSYLNGWGQRAYNWEVQASVQHQLISGFSVNGAYIRRSYGNLLANVNTLVSPSDYSPFCVAAPVDPRLPDGGGNQLCGFYDINPNKLGQSNIVTEQASKIGDVTDVYNGFDLGVTARLSGGLLLQAGTNTGREAMNNCSIVQQATGNGPGAPFLYGANIYGGNVGRASNPSNLPSPDTLFCSIRPPFLTSLRVLGVVPVKWGVTASLSYQDDPGPMAWASYAVPSSQVQASLGRPLAAGANAVTTLQLVSPGTMFLPRIHQVDARGSKSFKYGKVRVAANVDVYNLFNVSTALAVNTTYGPNWLNATAFMPGRFVKFGAQISY
jgi:hypothetical protein